MGRYVERWQTIGAGVAAGVTAIVGVLTGLGGWPGALFGGCVGATGVLSGAAYGKHRERAARDG